MLVTPTGTVEVVGRVQSLAPLLVAVRIMVCTPVLHPVTVAGVVDGAHKL